jgi:hypothetical protein
MQETFKMDINAMSPDGKAINCQSNIKIQCSYGLSVSVIAHLLKQEPRLKLIFAEAVLLALVDVDVTEKISTDEFLDSILKAKKKVETEL